MANVGVTVGGHDLNADPQEMKFRTYYLSNGTIRVVRAFWTCSTLKFALMKCKGCS